MNEGWGKRIRDGGLGLASEHVDVLIVGAGLSGIGAAWHLQRNCPGLSFAILEGRERIGGTWDLFRYPGVRSDSDMYTLGYSFRPWRDAKAIADGPAILDYIRATARESGIDRHIRFGHRARAAAWSTDEAAWTVEAERADGTTARITCGFLYLCAGYYDYARGHAPAFAGAEAFGGRIVHPQDWPQDLDYAGRRVIVIGSGATAVTLVPEMAKTAAHVTMLQRSPTYMVSRPSEDRIANALRRRLPAKIAYGLTRWKNVLFGMYFYRLCKRDPERVKRLLLGGVRAWMGEAYDIGRHFTPRYRPWDQRLCLVPDGDFFRALRKGSASIVTARIDRFTEGGIRLESGEELPADVIVSATGIELLPAGGMALKVDDRPVDLPATITYRGMMYEGVPNLAVATGYTNASWTLKADLIAGYVCRLLNHMRRRGLRICVARNADPDLRPEPALDFTSGYVQRALDRLPKQGSKVPWKLHQNYLRDLIGLKLGRIEDGAMTFSR